MTILVLNKKVRFITHLYEEMNLSRHTISKIKKGINHFTPAHIEIICRKYNVNANWIFGLQDNVFNVKKVHN